MLVGRNDERQRVVDAVTAGRSVVVAGPPGVGRTALLQAARTSLEGAVLVAGVATQSDRSLVPASWMVRDWPPPELPAEGAATATATWVRRHLPAAPLVCDDLDEADPATIAAFLALAREGGPVVVAVTTGTGRPGADALVAGLVEAGATVVGLAPLGVEDAALMARSLGAADPVAAAAASGGFPAAVAAIAAGAALPSPIGAEVAAIARSLSPGGRRGLSLLALCDGPVPGEIDGADELADAGLAAPTDGGWAVRSPLVASVVLQELDPGERAARHLEAASRIVGDPAAVVGHLRAGGDDSAADRYAEEAARAADDPAVEAQLWALLAARSHLASHRLAAARAAVRAADGSLAAEVLGAPAPNDLAARLLAAQAARLLGDEAGALDLLPEGTSVVGDAAGLERARLLVATSWRRPERVDTDASPPGRLVAALSDALGPAAGSGAFEEVARVASGAGDRDVELGALAAAVAQSVATGDPARARAALAELERRGASTGARSWASATVRLSAVVALHLDGDPRPALDLFDGSAPPSAPVAANVAYALAHAGRVGEAAGLLEGTAWPPTPVAEALRWWAAAEVAEVGARRTTCQAAAARCVEVAPAGFALAAMAELCAARSAVDAGAPPPSPTADGGVLAEAVAAERAALARHGQGADAARAYERAADAWEGRSELARLRCQWAAADAVGAAGVLEALEQVALDRGLHPLLARIRRSLRAAGVRRSAAPAERGGLLSAREREVLALVRQGLASPEIAARLGVARSTVESQIKSAVRKLGARTRVHAASMIEAGG